ncbi:unnamed protein product, partial [Trichobilharzia szidati]
MICEQCDREFTRKSHLKEHIRVKHEGKLYECVTCHKQLKTYKGLQIHRKLHEG